MRILLSCLQSTKRHPIAAYEFWRLYFTKGCEEAGLEFVEVPDVDWAEALTYSPGRELDRWRSRTWEAVLAFVRREKDRGALDFFLCYLYPQHIEVGAIIELQRLGIPCVNFFCDNVREFRRIPPEFRPFALHWVPEFEALRMYDIARLPYIHAPMPCWVPPELRCLPLAEDEPVTFLGSPDLLRRELLGQALANKADIVIKGYNWLDEEIHQSYNKTTEQELGQLIRNQLNFVRSYGMRGLYCKVRDRLWPIIPSPIPASKISDAVTSADYLRITREAIVAIGINRVPTAWRSNRSPISYSRLRDIEAPMLGACYLTEWTEGIGLLYEIGIEVETYRCHEELCSKIVDLKGDPVRRRLLRQNGQKRALKDHAVAATINRIATTLGFS